MKKKVRITKEAHYKPHGEFHHAAWVHIQHVEEKISGNYYSLLSAFLLSAFTLEAYLNYAGPKIESGWEDFDKCPPMAKLRHVCSVLGIKVDVGAKPFQSINHLFKFRNRMAHPRDEELMTDDLVVEEEYKEAMYERPLPKWMSFATEENAKQCHSDVEKVIILINEKLPNPDLLPLLWGEWSGSAST